ncbi:MAG: 3-phosphoshikimate 1-carboxyvinyltransferase [Clostridia bacterium]|nr:3-phosphoshikimate 1-carboxyvinyltransferase [Clostridia bacterium]
MNITVKPADSLNGTITVPGDKSISHRSVMLGSISNGTTHVSGFLTGADCLATVDCFRKMGIEIDINGTNVTIHGKGMHGLKKPDAQLDCKNSGTTIRLISGILAAQPFNCSITGDASIQKRPMDRIRNPLALMGAKIDGNENKKLYAPLKITGAKLTGIHYTLPVASAQVKSAVILAGLYADGETVITEPEPTRDHTEIMLNYLGADISHNGFDIICRPVKELYAKDIYVPGDISSAAYFMVAAAITDNSDITITNVGVNPTRTGIIDVLNAMGADIKIINEKNVCGEKVADIRVKNSKLKGTEIGGAIIPRLIDEIPIIAVCACFADGTTVIKDAQELKVKETNRIKTVVEELKKMGADITETDDGMVINGTGMLKGAEINSHDDHRIAMSMAVAALKAKDSTTIENAESVDISFPGFFNFLEKLK